MRHLPPDRQHRGASNTATLTGDQGQGFSVDDNLTVSGTRTYQGLVIVRGTFKTSGVGSPKVFGTVLANKVDFSNTNAGNAAAVINYSAWSIDRSMTSTSQASPMRSRGNDRMM